LVQPEKPRSKIRIYMDILQAIRDDGGVAKPTHILQKANLSHDRLTKHLGELVDKKLVSENQENGNRYYTLTENGIKFLAELEKAESFVAGFGLAF
jgi:predicted transcriptional regulator